MKHKNIAGPKEDTVSLIPMAGSLSSLHSTELGHSTEVYVSRVQQESIYQTDVYLIK